MRNEKWKKRMTACALAVAMFMSSVAGCGNVRLAMAQSNEDVEMNDSGNQSFQNYDFNLLTIDDKEISTKSNGEKATVLIFGRTTCGNTRATISGLAKSELMEGNELRVIYADVDQAAKEDVQKFASDYGNESMNFCYSPGQTSSYTTINKMMWGYAGDAGIYESVTLPVTVLVDENDQVQKVMSGAKTKQEILAEINKFTHLSYSGADDADDPGYNETAIGKWDTVYFGNYWQTDTNGDGVADKKDEKEPIRWRVLAKNGDDALLLSDKILDAGKYDAGGGAASWEKSDMRNWLNTAFYQEAFSSAEGDAITVRTLTTTNAEESWGVATNLTKEVTKDKVSLLSYDEICRNAYGFPLLSYSDKTDIRTAATTGYTAGRPGMYAEAGSGDAWWLRNSGFLSEPNGYTGDNAYSVGTNGVIDPFNIPANIIAGIRPVIYVNLSDTSLWTAGENVTAETLPEGETINGSMTDSAGNLPVADELPDWSGATVPDQTPEPNPSANLAHLNFTKQTEGGQVSSNQSKHNYYAWQNWSEVVSSYLEQKKDGTYERVEACEDGICIEKYSENFDLESSQKIDMPLPLFGGYFSGENYNFLVFGQENLNGDDSVEVLRIVKFDKDWKELGSAPISGINTTVPFDAGGLRMTETGGVLYIHTCHKMYPSSDGVKHQANMTFALNEQTMDVTQKQYTVWNISSGYVSHSFNQFIATDGTYIYRLDHGDANPRSVVLTKADKDNIQNASNTTVLSIAGQKGDNYTGVSVGGFALKGNRLVTVGNSVEQSGASFNSGGQRNIFVAVTDTGLTGTSLKWLTDYKAEDSVSLGNPYLVSCDDGYYVMWEEGRTGEETLTKIAKIDAAGNQTGKTHTIYARLSDCQPVLTSDNRLVWYTTTESSPAFYCLETDKLADYEYAGKGDVKDCVITLEQDSYEYSSDTSPYEPVPTVDYGDVRLVEGRDYEVSYRGNYVPGTAAVVIRGIGFFEGEKEVAFEIVNPQASPSPEPSVPTKTPSPQTPSPGGTTAPSNTAKPSGTVSPSKTATPSGRTTITTTTTYPRRTTYSTTRSSATVYPGRVSGVKAKNISGRAVKITWKKAKRADFYQVQIARNRAFTKGRKRTTAYSRSAVFFRLKKNATYYVRVRAVGYSNGKNRNGKWSAVKKVKIRK